MTAQEARSRSRVVNKGQEEIAQNLVNTKYLPKIQAAIKEACNKGRYETKIYLKIPKLYQTAIRTCLRNHFKDNGYNISIYSSDDCCFGRILTECQVEWYY